MTPERQSRLEQAARRRTEHIRLVVQDIHHPHNVSACLRSAEAFGVLNCHVVTLKEKFTPSTVSRGVAPWLHISKHDSVEACATLLKREGFRLCAALPHQGAVPLEALPVDLPLALVFGNEHAGLDSAWEPFLDVRFTIPMVGLVESFNISVAAAVSLYETTRRARQTIGSERYDLHGASLEKLRTEWNLA